MMCAGTLFGGGGVDLDEDVPSEEEGAGAAGPVVADIHTEAC